MRLFALPLVLCALFSAGCPAYLLSGLAGQSEVQAREVAPDATEVSLECDGKPCSAVPIEREVRTKRSTSAFWTAALVEFAGAITFSLLGNQKAASTSDANNALLTTGGVNTGPIL